MGRVEHRCRDQNTRRETVACITHGFHISIRVSLKEDVRGDYGQEMRSLKCVSSARRCTAPDARRGDSTTPSFDSARTLSFAGHDALSHRESAVASASAVFEAEQRDASASHTGRTPARLITRRKTQPLLSVHSGSSPTVTKCDGFFVKAQGVHRSVSRTDV